MSFWTGNLEKSVKVGDERSRCVVQSNPVITDTEGGIESVRINYVVSTLCRLNLKRM